MTDLTPNDLSHLSDEKFNALCPQGFHATDDFEPDNLTPEEHNALVLISDHAIAPPLSPAAQAVKDAVLALYSDENVQKFGWQLDAPTAAAALRAAAAHLGSCNASEELIRIAIELEGHD